MAWEESGGGKFPPLLDQFDEEESEMGKRKRTGGRKEMEEKYEERGRKEKEKFPSVPTIEARRSEN